MGAAKELTLKMYILCTTTGIWRPRLLAKAWEGDRGHTASLATLTCGPSTPLSSTSAHLHLGGVCYTLEDRVMGVQSCGTKVG